MTLRTPEYAPIFLASLTNGRSIYNREQFLNIINEKFVKQPFIPLLYTRTRTTCCVSYFSTFISSFHIRGICQFLQSRFIYFLFSYKIQGHHLLAMIQFNKEIVQSTTKRRKETTTLYLQMIMKERKKLLSCICNDTLLCFADT